MPIVATMVECTKCRREYPAALLAKHTRHCDKGSAKKVTCECGERVQQSDLSSHQTLTDCITKRTNKRLRDKGLAVTADSYVVKWLTIAGFDPQYDATIGMHTAVTWAVALGSTLRAGRAFRNMPEDQRIWRLKDAKTRNGLSTEDRRDIVIHRLTGGS